MALPLVQTKMTGSTEEKAEATEYDWSKECKAMMEKDPAGWQAWIKTITSSAKSRKVFQQETLAKVMQVVVGEWMWTSPTAIGKHLVKHKLKSMGEWGGPPWMVHVW